MEKLLFWLCWIAYFSTYIGRLNYSASLMGIILSEGFSKGQAGMIGTAFFFAYGAGQFVSGFLGDRLAENGLHRADGIRPLQPGYGGGEGLRSDDGGLVCKWSVPGIYLVTHDPADV